MRRKDKQITNQKEIEEVLLKNQICRIALCDGNIPYIIPVNYGYKNHKLYIHSATEGRKLDIIKKNNNVCFEISDSISVITTTKACGCTTKYRSVIGYGKVNIVTDPDKKNEGLQIIMHQHTGKEGYSFIEKEMARMIMLEIEIETLSGKKSGV